MIEERIKAALDPVVGGRVFFQVMPSSQATFPVIVYRTINTDPNNTICGASDEDARVEINLVSNDSMHVVQLRPAVFDAIEAVFAGAERVTDFDGYEPDSKLYRRIIEYTLD